jgi:chromosome segregation ATPase
MNDATELESSLAGAIGFFQNLRRKLGVLETDARAQYDQIHTLSSTLVAVEQDRRTDRQTLANLSGGLVKLQVDERRLEQQLNTVETLVAGFQQNQQHMQQTLAAVADDLQAQNAGWRQELEAKLAPLDKIVALEQATGVHREHIEQFSTAVEAQSQRLLQFDLTVDRLDQSSYSLSQALEALKTAFERHEQALSTFEETVGVDEIARRQLQTQQDRLDALTASSTIAEQNLQTAQQDIAHLKGEFEIQHRMQVDIAQIRQESQKHQDRLKHLETLMGKLAADTNSTRQILNVVQTDLTTQNDTLCELDQNWRDSLSTYQDRLSAVEILVAGSEYRPATFLREASSPLNAQSESIAEVPSDHQSPPSIGYERFEALETALTTTRSQQQELEQELSAIQTTLERQDAHFAELQNTLIAPLNTVQQRLGELENALDHLYQSFETKPEVDTNATLDSLRQAITEQSVTLEETQQLAWAQIQDLQQRLSEAEAALDHSSQAPESATVNADTVATLDRLHQAIVEQGAVLEETQQLAWAQIQDLQQRLSEAEAALDHSSQAPESATVNADTVATLDRLHQAIVEQGAVLEETQQLAWAQIQDLQQRLSEAEAALDHSSQAPEPATVNADTVATLDRLHQAIVEQGAVLEETQQLAWAQIQDLQQRLSEAEAALDHSSQAPEPAISSVDAAAVASLREDLLARVETLEKLQESWLAQAGTLEGFQETTHQQLAAVSAALDAQQQGFQDAIHQIANLQQDIDQLQQPDPAQAMDTQRLETAEQSTQELRHDLEALQESVAVLETRLSSQSQAFSGNFEQLRSLHTDLHAVQQQMARLDSSPRQLSVLEQELATHEQEINQLKEVVEQIQVDSQQMGASLQQHSDAPIAEIAARLDEQQEQWTQMAATVESIRADSKAAQETVVTMATNVAKRIHEIQSLLVVTENTQSERLQEVEQKLINLQAAFETLENQRKSRKWFSMPASLTSIMLTAGIGGLAAIAQVIWTIG